MNTLVYGFYGEGKRDYGYTQKIVERLIQEMLPHIDIISIPIFVEAKSQEEKLIEVAEKGFGYNLVVVHIDSDGRSYARAYAERFEPGYMRIAALSQDVNNDIIPVIPIKMTEAWMLVDFDAFKDTVGTHRTAHELGFPSHPHQIEAIPEPKSVFETAIRNARPGRRRKASPEEVYLPLAERVSLERLHLVPAYQIFKNLLTSCLAQLHYIDG